MAAGDPQLGTGLALVVPGAFTAPVLNIEHSGATRAMIDMSHMLTTGGAPFVGGLIYVPGELTVTCLLLSDEAPPMEEVVGAVTITWKDLQIFTTEGAISGFSAAMPMEDKMTIDVTITLSGDIDFNAPA
jgi:hypothetical protein